MKNWTVLIILLATFFGASLAAEEEPERGPAIERCRTFCAGVFGETGSDYDDCALACGDADGCQSDCTQKFGEDQQKTNNCLRACMRRKEPKEPSPDAPAEAPVKL